MASKCDYLLVQIEGLRLYRRPKILVGSVLQCDNQGNSFRGVMHPQCRSQCMSCTYLETERGWNVGGVQAEVLADTVRH